MKTFFILCISIVMLWSCQLAKPRVYLVPEKADTLKIDTSFTDGPRKYQVLVLERYTDRTSAPIEKKDNKGNKVLKKYRDLNFDITVKESGNVKYSHTGLNLLDYRKDLPKSILDSGILNQMIFKYYPESNMFVFLSRANIPETKTEKGTALILDKDYHPSFIVGGQ